MTFDDTLRDGSSFGNLNSQIHCINFHFYWYCLSLKANFHPKCLTYLPKTQQLFQLTN